MDFVRISGSNPAHCVVGQGGPLLLRGCGHLALWEQPSDLSRAMLEFFN